MCGISGFIDFTNNSSNDILRNMSSTLAHRGPDDEGLQFFQRTNHQFGAGHNRLSIIDLSPQGGQPMQYQNNWIVFNGEVYNFEEIKKELVVKGHTFIGMSDTEVVLHAYTQWGANCLSKFIGMFAFTIYNGDSNELFCARDRAGVKPFYYYWDTGLFLFASELKAFHKHPAFKKQLNLEAVESFVQYGFVPNTQCIFNNCFKLLPGHYMKFDLLRKEFHLTKYWDVTDHYCKPKLQLSFEEAKKETELILDSVFNYRMIADVPVGIFLSGGYDSSLLTVLLQKNRSAKLDTFTIGVNDGRYNEAPFARKIAEFIGTNHHELICDPADALDVVNDLPDVFDEPFADSSAIPTILVSNMARKKVKVALSADGGDEIFAGYNRYDYLMRYHAQINNLPSVVRLTTYSCLKYAPLDKMFGLKKRNKLEKLKELIKDPTLDNFIHQLNSVFTNTELKELISQSDARGKKQLTIIGKDNDLSPLSYMMMVDYKTYLTDDILQKVDRCSMSQSLEAREPYLDHRLIEFVAQLPDDHKYHKGVKKHLLKEITHHYLPKNLLDRPKMGFSIPIDHWLSFELKELLTEHLSEEKLKTQGIFNVNYVLKIRNAFVKGETGYAIRLWHLLMFQMWYKKWMA